VRLLTIAATVFLTLGTLLTGANYVGIARARRTQVGFSCVPILGGLLGCAGFLLLPKVRLLGFIPPLVDPGCVPMMLALLVHALRKKRGSSN